METIEKCQEIWQIFANILSPNVVTSKAEVQDETVNQGVLAFMKKIPGFLEKLPYGLVCNPEDDSEDLAREKRCFMYWLMKRLILLVHYKSGWNEIIEACINVQRHILVIVKDKNLLTFNDVIGNYLIYLQRLMSGSENLHSASSDEPLVEPLRLHLIGNDVKPPSGFDDLGVTLTLVSGYQVERLQAFASEAFKSPIGENVGLYLVDQESKLCSLMMEQLQICDLDVKIVSLEVMSDLVSSNGLPCDLNVRLFNNLLCSIIIWIVCRLFTTLWNYCSLLGIWFFPTARPPL